METDLMELVILDDSDPIWDEVVGDKFPYTCSSCGEVHVLKRIITHFICSHCHYKVKWIKTRKWKKWKKKIGELKEK